MPPTLPVKEAVAGRFAQALTQAELSKLKEELLQAREAEACAAARPQGHVCLVALMNPAGILVCDKSYKSI